MKNRIRDGIMKFKKFDLDLDYIWQANSANPLLYPPFKVIKDYGPSSQLTINGNKSTCHYADIMFLVPNMFGFNSIRHINMHDVFCGDPIKDYYAPHVPKVNPQCCLGDLNDRDQFGRLTYYRENPMHDYPIWRNIYGKIFNIGNEEYNACGALGVTLDYRWRCFLYFLQDLPMIRNYGYWAMNPSEYCLNYTMLQQNIPMNQRVISLQTVIFLTKSEHCTFMKLHPNR